MKNIDSAGRRTTFIWISVLAALFIAAVVGAYALKAGGTEGRIARVYSGGEVIREIDLSAVDAGYEFIVECPEGYNVISVKNGAICVSSANCSDHTCMKQGWLTGGMTPIVCLPHELVIQLEDAGGEVDITAGQGAQHGY